MDVEVKKERPTLSDRNSCTNQSSSKHRDKTPSPSMSLSQEEETQGDGSNAVKKKRKLTSVVWNHFEKLKVDGEDKAECRYCKEKLSGNSKNGTRHLHDHFENCPKRTCEDMHRVLSVGENTVDTQSNLSCYTFDPDKSRKNLAEMVMMHKYPLAMVEHHGFQKFVKVLQPLFKLPSQNTLKNDIVEIGKSSLQSSSSENNGSS